MNKRIHNLRVKRMRRNDMIGPSLRIGLFFVVGLTVTLSGCSETELRIDNASAEETTSPSPSGSNLEDWPREVRVGEHRLILSDSFMSNIDQANRALLDTELDFCDTTRVLNEFVFMPESVSESDLYLEYSLTGLLVLGQRYSDSEVIPLVEELISQIRAEFESTNDKIAFFRDGGPPNIMSDIRYQELFDSLSQRASDCTFD